MTDQKFQEYMMTRIDQVHKDLMHIKVELATLKGRAAVWGAVGGILMTVFATALVKFLK